MLPHRLQQLAQQRDKSRWRARLALIPFVQSHAFRHCLFGREQLGDRTGPLLKLLDRSLLEHAHPEIQLRACIALSQLAPCLDLDILQSLIKRFIKLSDQPLPADSRKNKGKAAAVTGVLQKEGDDVGNTVVHKRHAGVLGLGGVLCGFPFTVPE